MIEELQRLRKERDELVKELGSIVIGSHEHSNARDGVDYKYMRAVRIQTLNREIERLKRDNIRCVHGA